LEAQWLLAGATGLSRLELYTNYDQPLTKAQRAALRASIKRRVAGEPLQYILGKAPFRRFELTVRSGVLIPRPETEILVEVVIDALLKGDVSQGMYASQAVRVLDLCTGTGCVALSLLYECLDECAGLTVVATDIDPAAVELARENANKLALNQEGQLVILTDDLATSFLADDANKGAFDVVVSNPPYVPTDELDALPEEVAAYEPRLALDGGTDGLEVFRRIVSQAALLLKPGGLLACELHETRLDQAKAFCEEQGFFNTRVRADLADKPRVITAQKPRTVISDDMSICSASWHYVVHLQNADSNRARRDMIATCQNSYVGR
jgi:release factor glutamine methyltransferase